MKTLGVLCPHKHDALSYFRGLGPLYEIQNFLIREIENTSWLEAAASDAVFMQRPYSDDHLQMAKNIKQFKKPLWIDYDDYLFKVPASNPVHKIYDRDDIQNNMREIIQMADVVTVSTEFLAEKLGAMNSNTVVVPNAMDLDVLDYRKEPAPPRGPIIMWRGSKTHQRDLWEYRNEILELYNKYPNTYWHFLGDEPWFLSEYMDKSRTTFWGSFFFLDYYKNIHDHIRPQLTIVPLADHDFNHAKSNIAWLEASFAGSACLGPDWQEWRRPGSMTYSGPKGFLDVASYLIENPKVCAEQAAGSWSYIKDNLSLSEVNKKRMAILDKILF